LIKILKKSKRHTTKYKRISVGVTPFTC
jgi:hypothetical protein